MKKIILITIISTFLSLSSFTQVANFNLTDTDATNHDLYTYLSANKAVVLEFFMTTCYYCQNSVVEMEELYNYYGQNTDNVIVLSIEINNATDIAIEAFKTSYGPANYPKIGGSGANQYWGTNFYGDLGGSMAELVVIIPNSSNPSQSSIVYEFAAGQLTSTHVLDVKTALSNAGYNNISNEFNSNPNYINIYPIPANNHINISTINATDENLNIVIYDFKGSLVKNEIVKNSNLISLNISDLNIGIYTAMIQSENNLYIKRFQIVR